MRSIRPPSRVHRFAITAAPSIPTPSSRYTVRLGRGLFGLNLAGVIRSGTTRSGSSCCQARTAGCASRISRRFTDAAGAGARAGGAGGSGTATTGAGVVCATTLPPAPVVERGAAGERGRAVTDDDHGTALLEALERFDDRGLGLRVHRARGFVEDQHRAVLQEGARQRDALPLAARQLHAPL